MRNDNNNKHTHTHESDRQKKHSRIYTQRANPRHDLFFLLCIPGMWHKLDTSAMGHVYQTLSFSHMHIGSISVNCAVCSSELFRHVCKSLLSNIVYMRFGCCVLALLALFPSIIPLYFLMLNHIPYHRLLIVVVVFLSTSHTFPLLHLLSFQQQQRLLKVRGVVV